MSRIVGRDILDLPKVGHESLDMGRKILDIPKNVREKLDIELRRGSQKLHRGFTPKFQSHARI